YPVYQAFRSRTDVFDQLCAMGGVSELAVHIQGTSPERTSVSLVSGSYFTTLGVPAALGRTFTDDEDRAPGGRPVAVISDGYWQRRFARDPAIINRIIQINGTSISIVGVAQSGFSGEEVGVAPDLWIPLSMYGQVVPGRNLLESPGTGWLRMIGRVHAGVRATGPQPVLTRVFQQTLSDVFGPAASDDVRRDIANATVRLEPAATGISTLRAQFGRPLQLLMGGVVVLLVIACANIASLLLARAQARRREIDLRLALGVTRARLVRQLMTESLVLASIGGTVGVLCASWIREGLLRLISADGSRVPLSVPTDLRLLVFVAVATTAAAILFGLAPAWHSARSGLARSLVTRQPGGAPARRLNAALVIAQIAMSLVLLTSAGLFLRTMANLRNADLGFVPERLVVLDLNPASAGYSGARAIDLSRRILHRIQALPGVSSVTVSENGLLTGRDKGSNLMRPEGFAAGPEGYPNTKWDVVGPGYFTTSGITVLAGRDFTDRDNVGAPPVAAINEQMARRFFPGVNPIGRRLQWGSGHNQEALQVVAVVRDVKQTDAREAPALRFYFPYFQLALVRPNWMVASTRYLVRTTADGPSVAGSLRQLVAAEDTRLLVTSIDLGPDLVNRTLVRERMLAALLVAFGALAIGLACLGVYGLIAYVVLQRTSEIGIRMALGSQRGAVLWAMLRPAVTWIAIGIGSGLPLALATARAARSQLFGLSPADPRTVAGAVIVMSVLGLLAAFIPARRATHVDPLVALRSD
ncbi:MAG TPA: ABC transporter permease, partial [Vicinamibacterales bacterium]